MANCDKTNYSPMRCLDRLPHVLLDHGDVSLLLESEHRMDAEAPSGDELGGVHCAILRDFLPRE